MDLLTSPRAHHCNATHNSLPHLRLLLQHTIVAASPQTDRPCGDGPCFMAPAIDLAGEQDSRQIADFQASSRFAAAPNKPLKNKLLSLCGKSRVLARAAASTPRWARFWPATAAGCRNR